MRVKKDWIYNAQSYSTEVYSLAAGLGSAIALPLTVSQNARRAILYGSPGVEPTWTDAYQVQAGAALPEGGRQRVYGVDFWCSATPTDLAAGSIFGLGIRLVHFEQDNPTGAALIPVEYSMWEDGAGSVPTQWANSGFLKEMRDFQLFSTAIAGLVNRSAFTYRMRWRSRRGLTLGNERGLYIYMETVPGSRSLLIRPFARTLMAAPNAL